MTKRELLERIRKSRSEVENLSVGLSEELLSELPGPKPDWAAKDLLAHLAYWEHPTLDKLSGRSTISSLGEINAVNAELLNRSRLQSPGQIMKVFQESGKQVVSQIEELSDSDLLLESPWHDGKPLWAHLADDTCVHYDEHLPALRAWARKVGRL